MGISTIKKIILCADDYALNTPISTGILELVKQQRISAVSCIVNSPLWLEHAVWLKPFAQDIDIGLHFNLTEGAPLARHPYSNASTFPKLIHLLAHSHTRTISRQAIEEEFKKQLQAFRNGFGRNPDFIDGHQHVHQLPIIRDAILNIYQITFKNDLPYIRVPANPLNEIIHSSLSRNKNLAIYLNGTSALKKNLRALKIPHNTSFSGVYHFQKNLPYSKFFPLFLRQVNCNGLIMCHPASPGISESIDCIAAARVNEYHFLLSDAFLATCQNERIQLSRYQNQNLSSS